jgi:hypothetical protein
MKALVVSITTSMTGDKSNNELYIVVRGIVEGNDLTMKIDGYGDIIARDNLQLHDGFVGYKEIKNVDVQQVVIDHALVLIKAQKTLNDDLSVVQEIMRN